MYDINDFIGLETLGMKISHSPNRVSLEDYAYKMSG